MSTNERELNCTENVDSGLNELVKKEESFQDLADDVYNKTNLIITTSELFSEKATPYGMRLKELSYRLQVIAYGLNQLENVFKDVNHKNVRDLYSLDAINFPSAISLCNKLIEANKNYNSDADFSDEFEAIKKAIDNQNIKSYKDSIIDTQNARYEAMSVYFPALAEFERKQREGEEHLDPVNPDGGENTEDPDRGQFTPVNNPKEETKADTTDTSKTDTGKSDTKPSTDKTEPSKDTDTKTPDTKEPDKTIENKPQPDSPTTISDNKGSSGVSHGTSSSSSNSNGNGNYTFTNSGISASQDEPIESLTDENPTEGSNTTLPVDEEDVYTIPTDLSGVTSKTKNSSGGSGVLPVIGGLGAAAAVGVGAKIYMDNKKNNDNGEDSDETDEISDTDEWNETTDGNDGILADEWNEDDSDFEFEDSEADSDDEESGFGEI